MRVVGLQCDLRWEDPAANHARLGPRIRAAAAAGARLVVLPEMFPTGFSMDAGRIAEDEGGPSERFLVAAARETGATVGGSIAQRTAGAARPRNVFVLALPDGSVRRAAKVHPFSFGGESAHYAAGDTAGPVDVPGDDGASLRVTPLVCYDLRFPELFAALAPRTDLFLVVANWPVARVAHFTALLLARAIETQAYVLGVNRVGEGGGLRYDGGSRLVSPLGALLDAAEPPSLTPGTDAVVPADGTAPLERAIAGDVRAEEVRRVRDTFPFLRDRRPDVYARIRGDAR